MPPTERVTAKLLGLDQAVRQMRELPKEAKREFALASKRTADQAAAIARPLVPIREEPVGSYSGGALRKHIATSVNASTGMASIGIAKGATVVTRLGRTAQLGVKRATRTIRGKRRSYQVVATQEKRKQLAALGYRLIQPTKYGHFTELGHGGPKGRAKYTPWLGPAVKRVETYFAMQMRFAVAKTEATLKVFGYLPGS